MFYKKEQIFQERSSDETKEVAMKIKTRADRA